MGDERTKGLESANMESLDQKRSSSMITDEAKVISDAIVAIESKQYSDQDIIEAHEALAKIVAEAKEKLIKPITEMILDYISQKGYIGKVISYREIEINENDLKKQGKGLLYEKQLGRDLYDFIKARFPKASTQVINGKIKISYDVKGLIA